MSGAYCDGCGEGSLLPDPAGKGKEPVRCDLCGWTADLRDLPRKWMEEDDIPWTKRQRKREGTLFFLWLHFDPEKGDAVFEVMGILGLNGMTSSAESLVELEAKPSDEQLRRIAAVDGVRKVWLAP